MCGPAIDNLEMWASVGLGKLRLKETLRPPLTKADVVRAATGLDGFEHLPLDGEFILGMCEEYVEAVSKVPLYNISFPCLPFVLFLLCLSSLVSFRKVSRQTKSQLSVACFCRSVRVAPITPISSSIRRSPALWSSRCKVEPACPFSGQGFSLFLLHFHDIYDTRAIRHPYSLVTLHNSPSGPRLLIHLHACRDALSRRTGHLQHHALYS